MLAGVDGGGLETDLRLATLARLAPPRASSGPALGRYSMIDL
jgi:hypothetical protein